jgi:hypothetical protein
MKNRNPEGLPASSMRAVNSVQLTTGMNSSAASTPCPQIKELAQENARLADLCRYFSDKKISPQVLDQVGRLARLPIVDRIRVLKDANRTLMEYLSNVGEDPQIRQ